MSFSEDSASRAVSAAVRSVSANPSRDSSVASDSSSPGWGSTASISSRPRRSRSASRARSRAEPSTSRSSDSTARRRVKDGAIAAEDLVQVGAGVGIESLTLRLRLEQAVLVGLPVHGDQRLPDAGQRRCRDRGATQEPARAALGGDLAAEQQQVTLDLAAVLVGDRRHLGTGADHTLDAGGAGSGAYGAGVGPTAQQQPERGHQHGLAGTGLAGDHGQAGPRAPAPTRRSPRGS